MKSYSLDEHEFCTTTGVDLRQNDSRNQRVAGLYTPLGRGWSLIAVSHDNNKLVCIWVRRKSDDEIIDNQPDDPKP